MECSLSGFSVPGILQARTLECLLFPSPEDLPDPGIEPVSPAWQADSLLSEPSEKPKCGANNPIGLPLWLRGKESPSMQETWVQSLVQEDPHAEGQLSPCATTIKPVV